MPDRLEETALRSEEVQEILTRVPSRIIRYGNTAFLFIILLLLSISWFVKYPDIIVSQGILTTTIPPQKAYPNATAKVQHLLVENNQEVQQDDILTILQNAADYKDVLYLEQVLDTITYDKEHFAFPLDELPVLFLGDLEASFALFENAYIQYQLNKELLPYDNEELASESTRLELQAQLNNMLSRKRIQKKELEFKQKELSRSKTLFDKGVIAAQAYELKQLEFAQQERNYQSMDAAISQLKNQLSNTASTLRGIKINRTKENLQLYKTVIQTFNQLKKAVHDYEQLYVIRAQQDGTIGFTRFLKEGQLVQQGDLLFTVFPTNYESYVANVKTPVLNSGKLRVGQTTYLKLENFPEAEYGVIEGVVKSISQVPDKDGFYYVQIELPEQLITTYQKELEIQQETSVLAETVTDDLRLIERFFYQFKEVFSRT